MSKLATMVSMEYRMDIKTKSFWISTFLIPLVLVVFGIFIGYLTAESGAMQEVSRSSTPVSDDMTDSQAIGMISGIFLTMFVMMYGAQIFNKVKNEKCNRIVEVLISSMSGRDVMLSKVISVAMTGLTQILVWFALIAGILVGIYLFFPLDMDLSALWSAQALQGTLICLLYFIGGFVFYGALFAGVGALTDRNNENQGYLSLLMMMLMASFYIGIFSADAQGSALATVCFYLPFTSSTVGAVQSISGDAAWWQGIISLLVLYASALLSLIIAGKIYTSAVLLKGKKLTLRDLATFLKSK